MDAKISNRINELEELLECPDKLSDTDRLITELEIADLSLKNQKRKNNHDSECLKVVDKRKERRRYIKRDKAKHGCAHWSRSKRKKFLMKKANTIIRHSHLFSHKGNGFKRCFDVVWELD